MPAITLASVCRAAKPTTRPSSADEASRPVATRLTAGNCASASAIPITMIRKKISRRTSRRRVSATAEIDRPPTPSRKLLRRRAGSARSTSLAITMATTTVAMAVIVSRCSATNEAAMTRSGAVMASQATSSRPRTVPATAWARIRSSAAFADSWRALVWSRLGIFVVALYATLAGGLSSGNAAKFDTPALTHPFGGLGDLLFSPLARWDSVWYLSIANLGYGGDDSPRTAFFPLFPLLSRGGRRAGRRLGGGGPDRAPTSWPWPRWRWRSTCCTG